MKHFKDKEQVLSYIVSELIATLEDDIKNQKMNGEPEEDYRELIHKIDDIKEVQHLVSNASETLEALSECLEQMEQMKDIFHDNDGSIENAMDQAELAISNAGGRG